MSLVRIDWNPDTKKIRQFGGLLAVFALVLGGMLARRGRPAAAYVLGAGIPLGLVTALVPAAGLYVYKIWMSAAFVMGSVVSFLLLGLMYYGALTPLALLFRWLERDALLLRKPKVPSFWIASDSLDDKTYFKRLF
jgi:hypothetical protein